MSDQPKEQKKIDPERARRFVEDDPAGITIGGIPIEQYADHPEVKERLKKAKLKTSKS